MCDNSNTDATDSGDGYDREFEDCSHPPEKQQYAGYDDGVLRVYECPLCGYIRPVDPRDPGNEWAALADANED